MCAMASVSEMSEARACRRNKPLMEPGACVRNDRSASVWRPVALVLLWRPFGILRIWMVLFALLLVPARASAQTPSKTRYTEAYDKSWAVVIGIDAYRSLPRLNYAAADAQAVAALLPTLGFPRENTFLL